MAVRDDGCYGVLCWDARPFAVTVERTPLVIKESGLYRCWRTRYVRGNYETFEIKVDGHTRVLFHKGNTEADSEGCIIVAESFGLLNGHTAVLDSKGGFAEFMSLTDGLEEFFMSVSGR